MKFKPRALVAAAATALFAGVASQAAAAPQFTIDVSAITGASTPELYTGDYFSGTSTELLEAVGNTHTGSGWLEIASLSDGAVTQVGFGGYAGAAAHLYVTFNLESTLTSGTINAPGSTYTLTTLDFILWADPSKDTVLTAASVNPATPTDVNDVSGDDYALGFGQLISGAAGLTGLQGGVGAYLNSINTFAVCNGAGSADMGGEAVDATDICSNDTGVDFFVDPVPFYNIAFTEFNNTGQGIDIDGNFISITSASGGVDFNRVPAPGALALLGIGLIGFGAARRSKVK